MPPRRFIIDTDTASDDAVAILMALMWPDIRVEAITVVSGNVPVEQGSLNARYTVECAARTRRCMKALVARCCESQRMPIFFTAPMGWAG